LWWFTAAQISLRPTSRRRQVNALTSARQGVSYPDAPELTIAELERQKLACGDDINALADTLGLPVALLARRMRAAKD
jgi:hypothetical protein